MWPKLQCRSKLAVTPRSEVVQQNPPGALHLSTRRVDLARSQGRGLSLSLSLFLSLSLSLSLSHSLTNLQILVLHLWRCRNLAISVFVEASTICVAEGRCWERIYVITCIYDIWYIYIYIYIYIERERERERERSYVHIYTYKYIYIYRERERDLFKYFVFKMSEMPKRNLALNLLSIAPRSSKQMLPR